MQTRTQCVTRPRYTIPPLRISTFQPLEIFNQVETRREAEGPDVGVADGPLSSFQVDAEPHAPHSQLFGAPRRNGCEHRARFCPGSAGSQRGCTEHGTNVLQHRQKIQQHERVFLVRFQCGERTHIPNMSPSVEACKSPGGIQSEQCPAIHRRGVRCLHQGKTQDAASGLLTVWGGAGR
jgi:hypothetical protein